MTKKIELTIDKKVFVAELNDSATAKNIFRALPIQAIGSTWGDEIYFGIPAELELENPKEVVEEGDLAYWPPGKAFCIFYGLTPASTDNEIRPASAVNVIGKMKGDISSLKGKSGSVRVVIQSLQSE